MQISCSSMGATPSRVSRAGCEEGVLSEILAGEDWTRAASPPMTPGKSKFPHTRVEEWCVSAQRGLNGSHEKIYRIEARGALI